MRMDLNLFAIVIKYVGDYNTLSKIGRECYATKIEVAAMRESGQGLAFKNGYWGRCKTQ